MANWVERLIGETQAQLLGLLRRSPHTIASLAKALRLTDNAVRLHVSTLQRDGLVADVASERGTGGKPARVYALTREGEELFPKAYAYVLGALVEEVTRKHGRADAVALLRAVGERAGEGAPRPAAVADRVKAAADVLRRLGGDVEVAPQKGGKGTGESGWLIQGYGCPLAGVTAAHPEVCSLARAIVADITGRPVTECCERGDRPRCAFRVG